jgi:pyridoxine 5-phosphate synthase
MARLFINVDHVATLREARKTTYPDPVEAALLAEASGYVSGITVHLREDRRHISDRDVAGIKRRIRIPFNLEMAASPEIVEIALATRPEQVTLVPERREEITTEGGLDLRAGFERVEAATRRLVQAEIVVSLFVDPDLQIMDLARRAGASHVELHTGRYCDADGHARDRELALLRTAAAHAQALGLVVNAGHGLTAANVGPVASIPGILDLNIGHALVARSVFVGLREALREMAAAMAG